MGSYAHDHCIRTETSRTTGERLLSASDVVAWLREAADVCGKPDVADHINSLTDDLVSCWIDLSAPKVLGGDQ